MDKEFELRRFEKVISDILSSIETDIAPILHANKPEGGYFGVPRMVFCYIDFLGLMFSGWNEKWDEDSLKKINFSTPSKALKYIKNILGDIDSFYLRNAKILYEMYRHGSVHIYSPKKLESKSNPEQTIEWLIYKGDRESWQHYDHKAVKLRHLQTIEWEKNRFILPISTITLYQDLIESILLYRQKVRSDKSFNLLKKFVQVANALDFKHDKTRVEFWN